MESSPPNRRSAGIADTEPWVRYRTEYRDIHSGAILSRWDTRHREESIGSKGPVDEPIFELVTEWKARMSAGDEDESFTSSPDLIPLSHTKRLNLYSTAIINALQTVVKYYPSQDLSGSPVTVNYPYAVLVHHYDELATFKAACEAMQPSEMCEREVHASSHLKLLLRFLDETIMEEVRLEQKRNKNGSHTWDMMWVGYKPGSTRLDRMNRTNSMGVVVQSVSGGAFADPPSPWFVEAWSLDFDDGLIGRVSNSFTQPKFDGEKFWDDQCMWSSTKEFLNAVENEELEEVKNQIEYGKAWSNLLHKACKDYKGKSLEYPHNEVSECERNTYLIFPVPFLLHTQRLLKQDTMPSRNRMPLTPSLRYYFRWTGLS